MTESPEWLKPNTIPRSPEDVKRHYDNVSETYDDFVRESGYEAPNAIADLYINLLSKNNETPDSQRFLDAGCGTGLLGASLEKNGIKNIIGCDVSQNMLNEAAEKKVYSSLEQCDLLRPLPWEDEYFSAVGYCGVFSRFDNEQILKIIKEAGRVIEKNGFILFSHRKDLLEDSGLLKHFDKHSNFVIESVTESMPYLPNMSGYEGIMVQYVALKKIS